MVSTPIDARRGEKVTLFFAEFRLICGFLVRDFRHNFSGRISVDRGIGASGILEKADAIVLLAVPFGFNSQGGVFFVKSRLFL